MEPLNRAYQHLLTCLADAGGSADLDKHGRLVSGPQRHPLQGDSVAYLVLVSRGLIAGEGGKIILTEAGREAVRVSGAGRIRESA
jgi:hypothetical protein